MDQTLILWLIAVPVVIAALLSVLTRMRVQALHDLDNVLNERKDIGLYLHLLDNKRLCLLFSRRARTSLREEGIRLYGTSILHQEKGDRCEQR